MSTIFLSYRRDDSAATCGRVYERLAAHFGRDAVFKDVDDIPYGVRFPDYLTERLRACRVVLVLIGRFWLTLTTPDGTRRLDAPGDFVRTEIETALRASLIVVPVLVDNASMPHPEALPASIRELVEYNGAQVRYDPDFDTDMQRLIRQLERWLGDTPSSATAVGASGERPPASITPPPPAAPADPQAAAADITAALDAAARLLPGNDPAIAQARRELFPPPIAPQHFPEHLASLGFVPRQTNDPQTGKPVSFILQPTVSVPAGRFQYGEGSAIRTITLPTFQLARYPVTVAEYACFVRAGQKEPQKGYLGVDWRTQLTRLDHPVTCVSWHNATAYAAWLALLSGQPWRLPTEEEWEKAACWDPRTGKSFVYPWGDRFDKARCNTSESGIGTTTPVGMYGAAGTSPCGAEEMAGNVWEWINSTYDRSTDDRVLRGGSWNDVARLARAAYRSHNRPDLVLGFFGFRLVVASPVRAGSV